MTSATNQPDADVDVLIVGAGVAGLAAARLLAQHDVSCLLLEAGDAIGGRIMTLRRPGWQLAIELGAEFVHGRPAPTLALGGGEIDLVHVPEQRVEAADSVRPWRDTWTRFAKAIEGATIGPDRESVEDYLRRVCLPEPDDTLVRLLVEGYHAAALEDVSARDVAMDASRQANGFEQFRTGNGYDQVLSALEHELNAKRVRVLLGTRVERVVWSHRHVTIQASDRAGARQFRARRCVVTTSVGVLRAGSIRFEPEPDAFGRSLPLLAMGHVARVVLRFERRFWPRAVQGVEASFVHAPDTPFQTLWREARAGQEQITAWAGGPRARELESLDSDGLTTAALASLAKVSGSSEAACRDALLESHHHDFTTDPRFLGAYSYVRPGGREAAQELAEPCRDTLFFAGEALDLEYPSTVAGALASGARAARRLLHSTHT